MAIIKCFECGRDVSSLTKFCPHCGYDISRHIQNIMPKLENNFYIGNAIDGSMLAVRSINTENLLYIICHTHGISIVDRKTDKISLIPFSHIINLQILNTDYLILGFSRYIKRPYYLSLEYWDIRSKNKVRGNMILEDKDSIFVNEKVTYEEFIRIYKNALLKSASTPPEKISPEESARELIENFGKLEEKAHVFGCSFILFYILLLIFPAFSGMDPQSTISTIWAIVFFICTLIVFIGILRILNCFIEKHM